MAQLPFPSHAQHAAAMHLIWWGPAFEHPGPACPRLTAARVARARPASPRRYAIMRDYMPTRGDLGRDMMFRSCTVQVNLDFESESDMVDKMRVGMALQASRGQPTARSGRPILWPRAVTQKKLHQHRKHSFLSQSCIPEAIGHLWFT